MIRVLHVLGALRRGGVERWLLHLLSAIDRREVAMDFLVHDAEPGPLEAEAELRGARVFRCLEPQKPWAYAPRFAEVLAREGPYQVVHSHVHHFSALPLLVAARAGVPVRIAHSHCEGLPGRGGLARHAYESAMLALLRRSANCWIACSSGSAAALFGPGWEREPRLRVFRTGIDLRPFEGPPLARAKLGLSPFDVAIAHVGSFTAAKNHGYFVEIASAFLELEPRARFVLFGEGPLEASIAAQVDDRGLASRFIFAGARDDVPAALLAMDAFLFPSLREGLPLAVLEAQAAGLPAVLSTAVTREAVVVPELVTRLPLSHAPALWALALRSALRDGLRPWPDAAREAMRQSAFNLQHSAAALVALYRELLAEGGLRKVG